MRVNWIFAAALMLLTGSASAEPGWVDFLRPSCGGDVRCEEMEVRASTMPVIELGKGGCIEGPFTVRDTDGTVLFDLPAGRAVPAHCRSSFR